MKVLLIEDERALSRALQQRLAAQGLSTDVARDGETGLEAALSGSHDVIVLDIPRRTGEEVCTRLRAAELWTPVLVLSAGAGELDEVDALDLGADDYLAKPFSFPVLVARIKALARRRALTRSVLRAGDLRLDPGTRAVHRGEELVELTPREFALLEYLMRNRGQVVSRLDLLQDVWDLDDAGAGENVVEVYISYLRRKLDSPYGRSAIQTVRGTGYLLAPDGG